MVFLKLSEISFLKPIVFLIILLSNFYDKYQVFVQVHTYTKKHYLGPKYCCQYCRAGVNIILRYFLVDVNLLWSYRNLRLYFCPRRKKKKKKKNDLKMLNLGLFNIKLPGDFWIFCRDHFGLRLWLNQYIHEP